MNDAFEQIRTLSSHLSIEQAVILSVLTLGGLGISAFLLIPSRWGDEKKLRLFFGAFVGLFVVIVSLYEFRWDPMYKDRIADLCTLAINDMREAPAPDQIEVLKEIGCPRGTINMSLVTQ